MDQKCPSVDAVDEKHSPDAVWLAVRPGVVVRLAPKNFHGGKLPQQLLSDSRRVFPTDSLSSSNTHTSSPTHQPQETSRINNSGVMESSIQTLQAQVANPIPSTSGQRSIPDIALGGQASKVSSTFHHPQPVHSQQILRR